MKKLMTIVLGLMVAVGMAGMAVAGSIDSPGLPSAGSGMYTLQNLYDYLTAGTTLTVSGTFQEPSAGPAGTMKNTKQIGDDVKALFDQGVATAADVKSVVKFFSTVAGDWGVKTGTMSAGGGLLKTGQTSVYKTNDDGTYQKGTAFSLSIGTDSTVNDAVTGLQWQAGTEKGTIAWTSAITWAEGLVRDCKSDWRLPNITELQSLLVRNTGLDPLINKTMFPLAFSDSYWSSTTWPGDTMYVLDARFNFGDAYPDSKTGYYYVRAVRGGV